MKIALQMRRKYYTIDNTKFQQIPSLYETKIKRQYRYWIIPHILLSGYVFSLLDMVKMEV